jgi:hypothetical protein
MPQEMLNSEIHSNLKLNPIKNFSHISHHHVIPLLLSEFIYAAADCPVVFVKDTDTGEFQPAAIYGLEAGRNLFVQQKYWLGVYCPRIVENAAFHLSKDKSESTLLIERNNPRLSENHGEPLFTETQEESELIFAIKQELIDYSQQKVQDQDSIDALLKDNLLIPRKLQVDTNIKQFVLDGMYIINQEQFQQNAQEYLIKYHELGILPAIYAHFTSLNQARRLAHNFQEVQS